MKTSIFEIFKIGVGPSSSHTMGPMRAARRFALDLQERGLLAQGCAGAEWSCSARWRLRGMATKPIAQCCLGLSGEAPETIDPATIYEKVGDIRQRRELWLLG